MTMTERERAGAWEFRCAARGGGLVGLAGSGSAQEDRAGGGGQHPRAWRDSRDRGGAFGRYLEETPRVALVILRTP